MKSSKPSRVPVDASQWSDKSKRSVIYDIPPTEYVDIQYACWRCGASSTYTAEEQREAFETRKAYIWQQRILCAACWRERQRIERIVRQYRSRWRIEKGMLQRNRDFLVKWLELVDQLPQYGGPRDEAAMAMLRRLIRALETRRGGPTMR
jgi:hypothetical protein